MMARVLQTRVISFKRDSPRIVKGCLWYAPVHGGTWTFDGFFFIQRPPLHLRETSGLTEDEQIKQ